MIGEIDQYGHKWNFIDFGKRQLYCSYCKCIRYSNHELSVELSCSKIAEMMESHNFDFLEAPVLQHNYQNVKCKDCGATTRLMRFKDECQRVCIGYLSVEEHCKKLRMRRALDRPGTIYANISWMPAYKYEVIKMREPDKNAIGIRLEFNLSPDPYRPAQPPKGKCPYPGSKR